MVADTSGLSESQRLASLEARVAELAAENQALAEAVAARDAFLVVAAHELRNPMTPIVGRLAMLRSAAGKPGATPADLAKRIEEVEWLTTLFVKRATTLLDVSRLTARDFRPELAPVDAAALARTVVETFAPLAAYAKSELRADAPAQPVLVMAEPQALEQVLDNLVSNALKYAPGAPIRVALSADPGRGTARIEVRDGGPGIPPDAQQRIFGRFERAVRPGSGAGGFGVGLWIVRNLVEAMHGQIAIDSTPGAGAAFSVTLPLIPAKDPT
jgi:signal transduction histidine kinase